VHEWRSSVTWPEGKHFAFTVFDDPDGQSLETSRLVYQFLADLGFRTTIAVWALGARRTPNSGGETCANRPYLEHVQALAEQGFEVAWHNATLHTSTREETIEGLDRFRDYFGHDPASMANHYNGEALYWGAERLSGMRRVLYLLATRHRAIDRYFGHSEGHPYFWGDMCHERIRYCRSFVFSDLNTLRACPWMPYHDPERPWVNCWFAASEGGQGPAFMKAIAELNQDRLEAEGGLCILYTHFGHGFVSDGKLNPAFVRLMKRMREKNGWFVPSYRILDHLTSNRGVFQVDAEIRRKIEWRWLAEKALVSRASPLFPRWVALRSRGSPITSASRDARTGRRSFAGILAERFRF
jgi:hypothetical protein